MTSNSIKSPGISAALSAFVASAPDLPGSVVEDARRSVLDGLGSMLAGSLEPQARMVQTVVQRLGRSDEATVFSAGRSSAAGRPWPTAWPPTPWNSTTSTRPRPFTRRPR